MQLSLKCVTRRSASWFALILVLNACDDSNTRDNATEDASVDGARRDTTAKTVKGPRKAPEPGVHATDEGAIFQTAEFTVDAGQERFLCFASTLQEDLIIDGYSHAAQPIVHHVVFSRANAPEPDGLSECDTLFRFTWDPLFLTGAGASEFLFPEGVGHRLTKGTQLVVQLHLLNPGDEPVTQSVAIDMRRSSSENPRTLAPFVFGSSQVNLPPKKATTLEMPCELQEDVQLVAAFPHMHLLGTAMKLEVTSASDGETRTVFERKPYDFDDQHADHLDLRLTAGDKTKVSCTYNNTRDEAVTFGESTTNEMCFLIGWAVGREGLSGCSFGRLSAQM